MKQHISVTAEPLPFTPKILATGKPDEPVFLVTPMTQADYDRLGFELFRHNISPITQDTFRATIVDEAFNLFGDVEGEEVANLLDELWQAEDMLSGMLEEWRLREEARLWSQENGAPASDPLEMPRHPMPMRRRVKAQLKTDEIGRTSRRIRDLTIEMQSYEAKQRDGIARLVISGWRGLKVQHSIVDGIIPEAVFEELKAEIGKEAMAELNLFVMSLGAIDGVERGNSDSPPGSEPDQTGSPQPSGASESSDGNSTSEAGESPSSSNTASTPGSGSDETTAPSSNSTTDATGASPTSGSSPTDAL